MMRKKCKGLRTKEIHLCLKMRCSDVCVARKRKKTGKKRERKREEEKSAGIRKACCLGEGNAIRFTHL